MDRHKKFEYGPHKGSQNGQGSFFSGKAALSFGLKVRFSNKIEGLTIFMIIGRVAVFSVRVDTMTAKDYRPV